MLLMKIVFFYYYYFNVNKRKNVVFDYGNQNIGITKNKFFDSYKSYKNVKK